MHANCIGLAELRNWVVEVTVGVIKDEDKTINHMYDSCVPTIY
jgi:hypothetical protein